MTNDRIIGLVFMAFGLLALLSWLGGGSLIWLAALAALFLYLYAQRRAYGFLLAGSALAGLTIGLLLGGSLGAILVSLAVGAFVVDRLEPTPSRWALYAAALLAAVGLMIAIGQTGVLGSLWFALLLVVLGAVLLLGRRLGGWRAASPVAPPTARPSPVAPAPPPADAEASPESEALKNALKAEQPEPQDPAPLAPEAQALYRALESWRRQQAAEEAKPAYIVLTNESLLQIARDRPETPEALMAVRGIGPVKLERYGEAILRIVGESR